MGQPAARIGDNHSCPLRSGGPVLPPCAPTVLTGGKPQARATDRCECSSGTDVIIKGSATVLVRGRPAARLGDATVHGGAIVAGLPTVLIGDAGGSGGGTAIFGAVPVAATLAAASLPCMRAAAAGGSAFVAP